VAPRCPILERELWLLAQAFAIAIARHAREAQIQALVNAPAYSELVAIPLTTGAISHSDPRAVVAHWEMLASAGYQGNEAEI
jgi:hypothetical protein